MRPRAPLAVVAVTDLLLVVLLAGPWAAEWASPPPGSGNGVFSSIVSSLALPGWAIEEQGLLAYYMDSWRAGMVARTVVFLLAHLLVVGRFVRQAGTADRWRAARTGACVFGPAVGAIAGLATTAPASFDLSITVEDRADLRSAAILSLGDGAYWGLWAGAACWATLTVARLISTRRGDGPATHTDAEQPLTPRQIRGHVGYALKVALPGFAAAGVLLVVLGGPHLAPGPDVDAEASGRPSWKELVHYVRWWIPEHGFATRGSYAPLAAVPMYLYVMLILLAGSALATRRAGPRRCFVSACHAVIWAVFTYVAFTALWLTGVSVVLTPAQYGGRWTAVLEELILQVVGQLQTAAGYIALVGWVPALATALTAWALARRRDALVVPGPAPASPQV